MTDPHLEQYPEQYVLGYLTPNNKAPIVHTSLPNAYTPQCMQEHTAYNEPVLRAYLSSQRIYAPMHARTYGIQ